MIWNEQQRLNFYTEEFQPKRLPASLEQMLVRLGFIFGVLGCAGLFLLARSWYIEQQINSVQVELTSWTDQLAALNKGLKPKAVDPELMRQLEAIRRELATDRQRLQIVESLPLNETRTYELMVQQLAQIPGNDIWLTGIRFGQGSSQIQLTGLARSPASLPVYLGQLKQLSGFRGRHFQHLELRQQEAEDRVQGIAFTLDTRKPSDIALANKGVGQPGAEVARGMESLQQLMKGL